jgi:WD40 repeat protein
MNPHSFQDCQPMMPSHPHIVLFALLIFAPVVSAQDAAERKPLPVRCLAFSPDGSLLAAVGADNLSDGQLIVWETANFQPRWKHAEAVGFPRLAFSPDGRQLALSRFAPETKLFDVDSGEVTGELEGHTNHARCVAYTPDGQRIITGSYDTTIVIWDSQSLEPLSRLEGNHGAIYHVAVAPDGSRLAFAEAREYKATLWNLGSLGAGAKTDVFGPFSSLVPHVSFSPNGKRLAVSSWGGEVRLIDPESHAILAHIKNIGGARWAEYSPDGRWLAVATNGIQVYLFRADQTATPEIQARVEQLLARFEDDSYDVREQATHELTQIGPGAERQLIEALESPLVETRIRAREARRRLYDPEFSIQLRGHRDELECVTFSPDGKLLASGDRTGTIIVWRVADWQPVATLSLDHRNHVSPKDSAP